MFLAFWPWRSALDSFCRRAPRTSSPVRWVCCARPPRLNPPLRQFSRGTMQDIALAQLQHLQPNLSGDETLRMDQETFCALYERTARPLWAYLWRRTGDRQLADDLLQETYYRFLRTRSVPDQEQYRKNYLFRIATNL